MKDINNINELIARCLAGECLSIMEENALQEWINGNRDEYQRLSDIINRIDYPREKIEVDASQAWQKLSIKLKTSHPLRHRLLIACALAASLLLLLGVTFWKNLDRPEMLCYKNTAQEISEVVLPDCTQVTLYPGASLAYKAKKNQGERDVTLTGKAFFNVKRNTARPFVVQAAGISVEVLGTSFLVDADHLEPSVFVKSGTVKVSTDNQKLILKRNQQAKLVSDKTLQKDTITDTSLFYRGNTPVMLIYQKTKLLDVIAEIEKTYDVSIELKGNYEGNLITTSFYNSKPEDIIKELGYLCNGNYEKKNEHKYILYVKKSSSE